MTKKGVIEPRFANQGKRLLVNFFHGMWYNIFNERVNIFMRSVSLPLD
jgi:hypothetical protein